MWVLRALLLGNHRGWVPGEGLGISGKAWGWGGLVTGEGQGDPVGCVCVYIRQVAGGAGLCYIWVRTSV